MQHFKITILEEDNPTKILYNVGVSAQNKNNARHMARKRFKKLFSELDNDHNIILCEPIL